MGFEEFEKDFGYLMPFIERVAAAANSLTDAAARQELNALAADQREAWKRIRALLAGTSATSSDSHREAHESVEPTSASPARSGFTVGSLRGNAP